jgi:hypothetical protein
MATFDTLSLKGEEAGKEVWIPNRVKNDIWNQDRESKKEGAIKPPLSSRLTVIYL